MSAKKQSNRTEAVRDAVTGYTAVVLGIVCFLIALCAVMAGVRVVFQLSTAAPATTTVATATADSGADKG